MANTSNSIRAARLPALAAVICLAAIPAGVIPAAAAPAPAAQQDAGAQVEIRRTAYGIPHIKAASERALGYGIGYAYAEDNGCLLANEILTVRGQRARHLGADAMAADGMRNIDSDAYYRWFNDDAAIGRFQAAQSAPVLALMAGYAAGYNAYMNTSGGGGQAPRCAGQPSVGDIDTADMVRLMRRLMVYAGTGRFAGAILAAKPPAAPSAPSALPAPSAPATQTAPAAPAAPAASAAQARQGTQAAAAEPATQTVQATQAVWGALAARDGIGAAGAMAAATDADAAPDPFDEQAFAERAGSNAIAIGAELSANGRGLLLGNPHFPWDGPLRFYQMQLTIPGKFDVMGAALPGMPLVSIGFNRSLAWSHTVDTSKHFVIYRLQLDPRDPARYMVDGVSQPLTKTTVAVEVMKQDGTLETRGREVYVSRFGPLLQVPGRMEWTAREAFALSDVNAENTRAPQQWYDMGRAGSLAQLRASLLETVGIPWVNTLAVDAGGKALYANVSAIPNVDNDKLAACGVGPGGTEPAVLLDGSRSACAMQADHGAPAPDILAATRLPLIERGDYVQNSNDSAWLSNPRAPQTGFPAIVSRDGAALGARGRYALDWLERRAGVGQRISAADIKDKLLSNEVYLATPAADDVLRLCRVAPPLPGGAADQALLARACAALAAWDRRADIGSGLGYVVFAAAMTEAVKTPAGWAVPFDRRHPVATPRGLNTGDRAVAAKVAAAMVAALRQLDAAGLPSDAHWGDVQVVERGGVDVPIGGGQGQLGVYNAIESRALADGKRRVASGSSYIQVVSYQADGPQVASLMTFSESSDPASPHHGDQTLLFSRKQWVSLPFSERDIRRDPAYRNTVLQVP